MSEKLKTVVKIAMLGLPILVAIVSGSVIYRVQGGFWSSVEEGSVSVAGIYLGTAIVMVLASLFYRILYSRWYWAGTIALALIYSYALIRIQGGGSFFRMLLPIAVYCLLVTNITVNLFYNRSLIKIRTLLSALAGAMSFTICMLMYYALFGLERESGFLILRFVNGLYLFIFLCVGMSLADMVIYRLETNELRQNKPEVDDIEDSD